MFKKAVIAVALASPLAVDAVAIQKRDGAGGHHHHEAAAAAPASGYSAPASGYSAPASGYSAPASGYSAPASSYAAPASGYGAPATGYGAPAASYDAPASGYGAPDTGYGAPASGYGAPAGGYDAPGYDAAPSYGGGSDAALPDLIPFLIIGLIGLGLALLFPSYINVSGRKKRSAEFDVEDEDVATHVNAIVSSVVNSEQCLERIACEAGALVNYFGYSDMAKMAGYLVSPKYKSYYKKFALGKDCRNIKCGGLAF